MNLATSRLDKKRIRTIFQGGKVYKNKAFNIRVHNSNEESRVGFIIKKKSGRAIIRNKLRRLFRSCFAEFVATSKKNYWVLFEVYPQPVLLTRKEIRNEVFAILQNL